MKGNAFLLLPALLMLGITSGCDAEPYTVDDSYTVSQRYYSHKEQFPELRWPVLQFEPGQRVQFDRRYKLVGERELHIDIFQPAASASNRQPVMLVHGGGWSSGNKSHFYAMANLLAQRGYTVFLPEYRLSPESPYPAGLVDLNDAIVWIKNHADDYSVDADRLALGGGSSGGQMAALLAYTANEAMYKSSADDDTHVAALIDLDGLLDFTTPLALEHEDQAKDNSAAGRWFGGSFEKARASWEQASAARYVGPESPATLIISSGQLRFTAGSDEVIKKLSEFSIRHRVIQFDDVIHTFWLFEPYLSQVVTYVDEFLRPQATIGKATYEVRKDCEQQLRCYESIQAALDTIESDDPGGWARVNIAAGQYFEKVTIRTDKVHLAGAGSDTTKLHFDAVAKYAGKYHRDGWGTPGSATLTINADLVIVEGIAVENNFDYLSNDALPDGDPGKTSDPQAVALLLDVDSDRVFMNKVALNAYQDTLFADGHRAFIKDSVISGNVDFIFGRGQLLIEDSTIVSRRRGRSLPAGEIQSFIAAPSTQLEQKHGITFHRSRLLREDGVPDNSVSLARPWHPTTDFPDGRYADPNAVGQVSFIDCFMDAHIHEEHWSSMNGTARSGAKTDVFTPEESRFHETGSSGPGSRHVDIDIRWDSPLTIGEINDLMFSAWPGFESRMH